eukprot:4875745-Pleurochrysis_carterae.AAC.3
MVNCHPTLALAIVDDTLKDVKQMFEPIRQYVYHREETLAKIMADTDGMTRKKTKDAVIRAINTSNHVYTPSPTLRKLDRSFKMRLTVMLDRNPEEYATFK